MANLKNSRAGFKSHLTRLMNLFSDYEEDLVDKVDYDTLSAKLEDLKKKLEDNHEEILKSLKESEVEAQVKDQEEQLDKISPMEKFLARCLRHINKKEEVQQFERAKELKRLEIEQTIKTTAAVYGTQTPPVPQVVSVTQGSQKVKLPPLQLPKFSGKLEEWLTFRDRFTTAIHNNDSLCGSEKLGYLMGQLEGVAADVVAAVPQSDDGYATAWTMVTEKFNHTRELTFRLIQRVLTCPEVKRNASSLQQLVSVTTSSLGQLRALGRPTDGCEDFVVSNMVSKLDDLTRQRFFDILPNKNVPTLKTLTEFLDKEIANMASREQEQGAVTSTSQQLKGNPHPNQQLQRQTGNRKFPCKICDEDHPHFRCPKLNSAQPMERRKIVDQAKLCTNCFGVGHAWNACTSFRTCMECKEKHNTLLHESFVSKSDKIVSKLTAAPSQEVKIMPTAVVTAMSSSSVPVDVRVIIDTCSSGHFVSAAIVNMLGLPRKRLAQPEQVSAIQEAGVGTVSECVELVLKSKHNDSSIVIQAFILDKIGGAYPSHDLSHLDWSYLPSSLADPAFYMPRKVDILLGTDVFYDVTRPAIVRGSSDQPVAQESLFGWLVGGGRSKVSKSLVQVNLTTCSIDEEMKKFWEIEAVNEDQNLLTKEEEECEQHFKSTTTTTNVDGVTVFQVALPFKKHEVPLGQSLGQATKRLYSLENKFVRNPLLKEQYSRSISELIQENHMEKVPQSEVGIAEGRYYYLPHHAVIKESSSTTKCRIVFDASARTTSGKSLNEQLMIGPTLQEDLFLILVRWRYWPVALKADIKQMYLQVAVSPHDRDFLRIVWRDDPSQPLSHYRLKKVTFGTACAPYQAVKTLQIIGQQCQQKLPEVAKVISRDFYMDDCMTGAATAGEASDLQENLFNVLKENNFNLRKWASSHKDVISKIPKELRESQSELGFEEDDLTTALGLTWNSTKDEFSFMIRPPASKKLTKRAILSEIARVFDPLGFLAPVTIRAKCIMQSLWKEQTEWDRVPSKAIIEDWIRYQQQLPQLHQIRIPRCIIPNAEESNMQLHVFTDASEKAYAAAVYLRTLFFGGVEVRLITSKSRVAPLKAISLPRLELCGAELGAQLLSMVKKALPVEIKCVKAWSDSTIALGWIKGDVQRLQTFERNRVVKIQRGIPASDWSHVPGVINPADLPTRGIAAEDLPNNTLWFNGPEFLHSKIPFPRPGSSVGEHLEEDVYTSSPGEHPQQVLTSVMLTRVNHSRNIFEILNKYSDWDQLRRHVAWWILLFQSSSNKKLQARAYLSASQLQSAEIGIMYAIQHYKLEEEFLALSDIKNKKKSKLLSLAPFVDTRGILRVGGRIKRADIPYDQRHPILLPKCQITDAIIWWHHVNMLHAGLQLTLTILHRKYWIVRARSEVRRVIRRCKICAIQRATRMEQYMADLPQPRVSISRPFSHVGVDYAGPLILKDSFGRSPKTHKAYIAVFVCFSVKAVHLELVSSLTTEAFLAALSRFVSRRGRPVVIQSDRGTNFVGASRELKELEEFLSSKEVNATVNRKLSKDGIEWKMNPPAAPHMGGLWEAAVKSAKFHIKRTWSSHPLNFEEQSTLIYEVEAILNSRPLCPASGDPSDLEALTPGHFLINGPLVAVPEYQLTELKVNTLSRWQRQQQIKQHFWNRWKSEYLQHLQKRTKWKKIQKNLEVGDMVVISEDNLPPQSWKLGRIVEVHKDQQDEKELIRTVSVKTSDGTYKRPIAKLVLLPTASEDDEEEDG